MSKGKGKAFHEEFAEHVQNHKHQVTKNSVGYRKFKTVGEWTVVERQFYATLKAVFCEKLLYCLLYFLPPFSSQPTPIRLLFKSLH